MNPFIIITGMHRSGTSFLARALNLYGVHLGNLESLLSHEWRPFDDNPRGHWENKKIYELAEKTLKNSKGSWYEIPKKITINKKIGLQIKNCVKELEKNSQLASGFKDPRILLCYDSWLKYLPKKIIIVGIFRNPLKVAESLKKRNNFSYEKSLHLWKIYNQNLLSILDRHDGFLLDFDWSKKKLFSQIELLSKKLGLAKNIDLSDWYTEGILFSDKTYKKNYKLSSDIKQLYLQLKKKSQKNNKIKIKQIKRSPNVISSSIENLISQIHNQSKHFTDLYTEQNKDLKQKTIKVTNLQKEYDERSQWALSLDKELKQKTEDVAKLQKQHDERSEWALSLDKELKQKTEDAAKLQKQHDERSQWALSIDKELKQKTEDVAKLQKQHDERSEWALSLDKELKQKTLEVVKLQKQHEELQKQHEELQKQHEERSEWALSLDKELKQKNIEKTNLKEELDNKIKKINETSSALKTKESQIEHIQNDLIETRTALDTIKNSAIFGIVSGIARKIDKIAPKSTRRAGIVNLAGDVYLMKKEKGTRAAFGLTKNKIIKKKLRKGNTQGIPSRPVPKDYLKSIQIPKSRFESNILKIEEDFKEDPSLRKFIQFGAHDITNLPKFPKISIIIITYNQIDALRRNLSSIESKSTYKNYEILIVTNNLDTNSEMRKFLKTVNHPIHVFEKEYSFGGMNNFGATKAQGEFLLFLNDDVEVVTPTWLEAFLSLAMNESTGAVGGKLVSADGKLQDCGGIVWKDGNAWNYGRNFSTDDPMCNYVRDVDYCSGSCLFIKKEIFEKVEGFDSEFEPAYWEDTDLCFSIRKLGYRVLYQPLAQLIHYEGSTQGTSTEKGIKSYQLVNQKKFYKKWKPILDSHLDESSDNTFLERNRRDGLNILYIDHYVIEPDKDSGSLRTFRILGILSHMKNKVTFWPENLQYTRPYVSELQQKGIEVIYGNNDFGKFLDERKNVYDIAILARPYIADNFIDSIKSKMPHCKIIYDTIDLHFLRMSRENSLDGKPNSTETENMRELELSIMKKSDLTILTSIAEAKFIHQEDNSLKLSIIPNIHTENKVEEKFEARKNMLFLAGFNHIPNRDSAKYLVNDIWPLIKKELPESKLYIVGSNPTEEIKNLAADDIIVTGFVRELLPYYKECKLMLAPLRYGAGIKGKITQSFAMGLPVVTTPIGVEGINLVDGKHCMIANSPEEFAKKAIRVYKEKNLWDTLSDNGLSIARKFSPESARASLTASISSILKPE